MATFHQQLTWHLKKADLKKLLDEAGDKYSALAFTIGIDDSGTMQYHVSLVNHDNSTTRTANLAAFATTATVGSTVKACPVPPDCR